MDQGIVLENSDLRLQCLPQFGGKITSLQERATGEEFLLPPAGSYGAAHASGDFADGDRGGYDDCFPTVTACQMPAGLPECPDHGEVWNQPWTVMDQGAEHATLRVDTASGFRLTRRVSLQGSAVHFEWRLGNLSGRPLPWLWAAHPLLLVEPGDRILLPGEVSRVRVSSSSDERLRSGQTIPWPRPVAQAGDLDLSLVGPPDNSTAHKLFVQFGTEGWCGLRRSRLRRTVRLTFAPEVLPCAGLWICFGAWPQGRTPGQYTVAPEPSSAPFDSLFEAQQNGGSRLLQPRAEAAWSMSLEISGRGSDG